MEKKRYIIKYDKEGCIGAGACEAAAPEFWKLLPNGKATIISDRTKKDDDYEELEIEAEDFEKNLDAAKVCPVQVIEIFEKESGKRIFPPLIK